MSPPRNWERVILRGVGTLALLGLAFLAFRAIGWFGVGLLGLFVLFVAIRFELEGNRPIGPQMTPGLYATQFEKRGREHAADEASRRFELSGQLSSARLATVQGSLLALTGFGAFYLS